MSSRHIAIAVGSLREASFIEIHEIGFSDDSKKPPVAILKHHTDMIDSLLKVNITGKSLVGAKTTKLVSEYQSPYV